VTAGRFRFNPVLVSIAALVMAPGPCGPMDAGNVYAAGPPERQLEVFVAAQTSYDDKPLQAAGQSVCASCGARGRFERADRMDVASLGLGYQWLPGAQIVKANAGLRITVLPTTASSQTPHLCEIGVGLRLADRWSGQLGANYNQALANFANNHFLQRTSCRLRLCR